MKQPCVFGIYGLSNTGKTTLISELISRLNKKGIHCGAVKCSEKHMTLDTHGKDTWFYSQAGSEMVVFSSPYETVYLCDTLKSEYEMINELICLGTVDIIFIEGARDVTIPKIRIGEIKERGNTVFQYQDNIDELVEYIESKMKFVKIMDDLQIKVNGKEIPLTEFPSEFISNTICGMLQSLKGVKTIRTVDIHLHRK